MGPRPFTGAAVVQNLADFSTIHCHDALHRDLMRPPFPGSHAGAPLPMNGRVFISLSDVHKQHGPEVARLFADLGFEIVSTSGTAAVLEKAGLKVQRVFKLNEGRPNTVDLLKNREIHLVINTPSGQSPRADEVRIRTTAVYTGTPIMTTLSGAKAAALGIAALKKSGYAVKTIQEFH